MKFENLKEAELYKFVLHVYYQHRDVSFYQTDERRFSSFIGVIVLEMDRIIEELLHYKVINNYIDINIESTLKQKLRDFNIDSKLLTKESKLFYKAVIAGLKRKTNRVLSFKIIRAHKLKDSRKRFTYYYVDMILHVKRIINNDAWEIMCPDQAIIKGNVSAVLHEFLSRNLVQVQKLDRFLRSVLNNTDSVLYDLRDIRRNNFGMLKGA